MRRGYRCVRNACEVISFLAVIVGVIMALVEYNRKIHDDAREVAYEKIYREVDDAYRDYLKLAFEHPRLDGYSKSQDELGLSDEPALSSDERMQQRYLYNFLIDVCEVAYVAYNRGEKYPEIQKFYEVQWGGWDNYI